MSKKTKLELTWIGKDNRPRLEPRILIPDDTKSHQLRNEVAQLHAKWCAEFPAPPPTTSAQPLGSLQAKPRPVAHAMTHNEAAKRLGVRPEKIRTWLESGLLKGQQLTRTKWQVNAQDLVAFAREPPELV